MIGRPIHEWNILTGAMGATNVNGTPVSLTVKQQRRRLEGFVIFATVTFAGAATTAGACNAIARVQVKVNDVMGSRHAVDAAGVSLIDEHVYLGGALAGRTRTAYGGAATTHYVTIPVFIRHPQLDDPFGNLTSIPLYSLREDVTLTITPGSFDDVGATSATLDFLGVKTLFRDIEGGDYIPSEILTNDVTSLIAGARAEWELPGSGLLTSVLVQHFNEATTRRFRTRAEVLSGSSDTLVLSYGRETIRTVRPAYEHAFNELATDNTGVGAPFSFLFDLADDLPQIGPYSFASALNLSSLQANGDVAKLTWSTITASNLSSARITTRKFLGGPIGSIQRAG